MDAGIPIVVAILSVVRRRSRRLQVDRIGQRLKRTGRLQVVSLPLILVHHQFALLLLVHSPLRIPQSQPGLGTQLVAMAAQEVDLVLCECGHRYGFHSMWRRQTAPGKEANRKIL